MDKLSFIILRYVSNKKQNLYWNYCYNCIRKFYKREKIYIIDDHSKYKPTRLKICDKLFNTTIINSELPAKRGELLPYYYYYTKEFSENTIILHDTVFINSKIDSRLLNTQTYHFLWNAKNIWDYLYKVRILEILTKMNNSKKLILRFNNKTKWNVCFGGMAILNLNYIKKIFDNTNYFEILISEIKTRNDRMCFERIIAVLLTNNIKTISLNGDIHNDQQWGYNLYNYLKENDKKKNMYKIWVGRK